MTARREPDTPQATLGTLRAQVVEVARAFQAGDEESARFELRALATEARTLASQDPLFAEDDVARRQRIAAERGTPKGM